MAKIDLTPQPEFLMILERLVEAIEENNRLLRVTTNQNLGSYERTKKPKKPRDPDKMGKPGREPQYDYGKIMALYNAGWSYQKIADEVGCGHSLVGKVVAKYATRD